MIQSEKSNIELPEESKERYKDILDARADFEKQIDQVQLRFKTGVISAEGKRAAVNEATQDYIENITRIIEDVDTGGVRRKKEMHFLLHEAVAVANEVPNALDWGRYGD